MYFKGLLKLNIKTFAALFVRVLSDLQALVYKQETRNLTLFLVPCLQIRACKSR